MLPNLEYPLDRHEVPELFDVLDLIEFIGQHISLPNKNWWHSYFRHYELDFDREDGKHRFRQDVNYVFERNGVAFTLDKVMRVRRLGPPESRQVVAELTPDSGDSKLDALVVDARNRFLSARPGDRHLALEKLWDAFERLKTLESGTNKKQQVSALLERVSSGEWRERLNAEMQELTTIGNAMQIRHFETNKEEVPEPAIDYLFTRLSSMTLYLLRETGRLE